MQEIEIRKKEENMNPSVRLILFPVVFLALTFWGNDAFSASVKTQCPQKEKIVQGIQKAFPKIQFEIARIEPSKIKGLCQVHLKIGPLLHLLYVDSEGEYGLAGNLHELRTGRNLTQETTQLLNRLTSEELHQLESLTAFTLGQGKR